MSILFCTERRAIRTKPPNNISTVLNSKISLKLLYDLNTIKCVIKNKRNDMFCIAVTPEIGSVNKKINKKNKSIWYLSKVFLYSKVIIVSTPNTFLQNILL